MTKLEEALAFFDSADRQLGKVFDPPEGFLTIHQVAKAKGWSHMKARQKLQAMAKHGLCEERPHRLRTGNTTVYGNFKN
jgi:hypothetical protein